MNKKGRMDESDTQRLSQEDKCNQASVNSILEEAESLAQGVLESIQATAGTTACKGVQITHLAEWAKQNGCWVDDVPDFVNAHPTFILKKNKEIHLASWSRMRPRGRIVVMLCHVLA